MAVEKLKIICVVLTYWTISISMVFINKYLLGDAKTSKDVSLFIAWVQCIICVMLIYTAEILRAIREWRTPSSLIDGRGPFRMQILTLTCTFVGMLAFNNLCLLNVGVSFYQVARSLTLIFVVIFSVTILKKGVSWRIVLCCGAVAAGFVLGVDQESLSGSLSTYGVLFGILTSTFVALNGIFTKTALEVVDKDSVKLTLYNNMNACLLFIPFVVLSGQLGTFYNSELVSDRNFWICLIATGFLGFLMSWISAVQINLTSPVTHHISANAKAVLQTIIAVVYHKELKSPLWWCSILLVVGGALSYALVRISEENAAKLSSQSNNNEVEKGGVLEAIKRLGNGHIGNGQISTQKKIENGHTAQG